MSEDQRVTYVRDAPEVYIEDGLFFMRRSHETRVLTLHNAERTARMVLAALDDWRAAESGKIVRLRE